MLTRAEFAGSGFTLAHLEPVRFTGYRTLGTLTAELVRLCRAGEPLVYAYYEGLDKVSHEYGLGAQYDEELRWIDHLVATLLEVLPAGTVLAITADHGQVETGDDVLELPADVITHVAMQSGEGRFRWLHARSGRGPALADAASSLLRRPRVGAHPRAGHRRGLVRARRSPMRRPADSATCCSRLGAPSRSTTPRTPARTCSSAATAPSRPTRCSCRSSPAWPEAWDRSGPR